MNSLNYFFRWILISQIILFLSCKTSSNISNSNKTYYNKEKSELVINEAKKYLGVPYKFSGNTIEGIDCSGLMFVSFKFIGIILPRKSVDQSKIGKIINLNEVKIGDVLFFDTFGYGISHIGLVESIKQNEIFFIHSSTKKGVIISSLNEEFWKSKFIQANRIVR